MSTTLESTEALILTGEGYSLEIAPNIVEQKAELIRHSALIVQVNDPVSSDAAGQQIKLLAAMRNVVEKSRKLVKEPVLEVGRRIDALASDFQKDITAEEGRLKSLQGGYDLVVQQERNRVLAEIEKARQAEEEKARLAEAARLQAEREAEEARRKAEELAFNAASPEEDAEAARLAAEAAAADKERLRIAAEEAARVAAQPAAAPAFVPEAPKGVKMVPDFEVTDLDALYRHNVGLVKMEPRREEILRAIAGQTIGDTLPTIPGLRVFLKPQVR